MYSILFALCSLVATPKTIVRDTIAVHAMIDCYKREEDGDIHLVLSDSGCTMIAEIEDGSPERSKFKATSRWKYLQKRATITGVRYYDHIHGQRGVAPNGIEIHPVLKISFDEP